MEKENKRRWYSIAYIVCVVLLLSSIPFSMLINNEIISFILTTSLKIIATLYLFCYIKKDGLDKPLLEKHKKRNLLLIPLIILPLSNIFVALFTNLKLNESINYFNIISGIIDAIIVLIYEEILFRGLVFNELLKTKKVNIAIIIQALIFGSIHLLNINSLGSVPFILAQVIYTAYLGVILGIIYFKTKNIIYPIIFHLLFNVFNNVISVNLFIINWDYKFFLINILIGIITIIYAIYYFKGDDNHVARNLDIWYL